MPKKLQLSVVHEVNLVDVRKHFPLLELPVSTGSYLTLSLCINAFTLFIDDEIIDVLVVETNRYV